MIVYYLECVSPLGMEDGRIKDSQITTSSVIKGGSSFGWHARFNKNIHSDAWCANSSGGSKTKRNYDQYVQIDLLTLTEITEIAAQRVESSYPQDYKISYRRDGGVWNFYHGKDETVKVNLIDILNLNWCVRILKISLYSNVYLKNEISNGKHFVQVFFFCINTFPDYSLNG